MNKFKKSVICLFVVMSMAAPAFAAPADTTDTDTEAAAETVRENDASAEGASSEKNDSETEKKTETAARKSSVTFSDINSPDFVWAKPYITDMASMGLISGYEDGTYRPDNDVTRQEAISLFARAMGSVDEANGEVLEIAHDRYDNVIKNYYLSWGQDEIAYMMYKGALKKTDLDTYLKNEEKTTPMKRYEAAIIITKAMGGEEEALSDLGVVLDYDDAREVPSNAIQYVAYATEKGIMEGMGDGTFSPNTPVKRSQIAVMLSKTVDKMDYSFKRATLSSVDTSERTITVTDGSKEEEYVYTDATSFKNVGDVIQPKDIIGGVGAVIAMSGKKLVSVDIVSSMPDMEIKGKYVSYTSTSGKTTMKITSDETGETETYEVSPDISVTYDGSPATVKSFSKGDVVTIELHDGKVVKMSGNAKETVITNATVTDVDISDGIKITISHGDSEYDGKTYPVNSNVTVKKNDASVGLDSIYPGDKVKLTLQYEEITSIAATASKRVEEGTIQSLTIASPRSTMTVKIKNQEKEYVIPADVDIRINGNEGTLYDFRVGDAVTITTESDAITKIVATSTQESTGSILGVVTGVNTSYGVISIKPDGAEDSKQVFCKDDATTFISADGKAKKMKDVAVGQTVEVKGTVSNGVFVGKLLIIVSE